MQMDQDSQGEQPNEEGNAPRSNSKVLINKMLFYNSPQFYVVADVFMCI